MPPADVAVSTGAWILENGHRAILAVTGGRWPRTVAGMQPLELHVVGRTSKTVRSTLLTAPICEEDRIVLVASKGGHSDHPQWYKNLVVNPDVEITVDGETRAMKARTASGAERDELWAQVTSTYRGYAGYQARTDREIPVVVCEPA